MTAPRVAGLDLALGATGIAYPDGSLDTIWPHGDGYSRLRPMATIIVTNLGPHGDPADLVVIEGYDPHPRGALALIRAAELGGMIRAAFYELRIPFLDIPPSVLKKFATGKGNANKAAMIEAAKAAGAQPKTDDEADAYWLRIAGRTLLQLEPRAERDTALEELFNKHLATIDRARARRV